VNLHAQYKLELYSKDDAQHVRKGVDHTSTYRKKSKRCAGRRRRCRRGKTLMLITETSEKVTLRRPLIANCDEESRVKMSTSCD
jgi:hypothetical protein